MSTDKILHQALSALHPLMTERIKRLSGPDAYFDAKIHTFKLAKSGLGPLARTRYYGLQRNRSLPAPFPLGCTPTTIWSVVNSAVNKKTTKARALKWFNHTLTPLLECLEGLVLATRNASVDAWPFDVTIPDDYPEINSVLIPSASVITEFEGLVPKPVAISPTLVRSLTRVADLAAQTIGRIKWSAYLPPVHNVFGGHELCNALQDAPRDQGICLLFYHAGGDPLGSPLAWVNHTRQLHRHSTIAYAFRCGPNVGYHTRGNR